MLKVKDIRPAFTKVITTANKYESDVVTKGGIIEASKTEGNYKEYQTVVRVGNSVREVKPGDVVLIDPSRYVRKMYDNSIRDDMGANPVLTVSIPTVQMNDEDYFLIDDRDILYVIEDYEEVEDVPVIESNIILPKEPKIDLNLK